MNIYLAGPVVTIDPEIKKQMENLEEAIDSIRIWNADCERDYVHVYRPGKHKVPNAWGMDIATWGQCVFTMDVVAIDDCDWMVLADYGRHATAGTSWEAGYAFAKGIKILVVQMPGVEESSLMTQGCAANIVKYEDFIEGIDEENLDARTYDEFRDSRFEKFFYERGRMPQKVVLN